MRRCSARHRVRWEARRHARKAILAIRPAPPAGLFIYNGRHRGGKAALRSVAEYLAKAAEFGELAGSASEPALKSATLTWLSAIAFWPMSDNGSLRRVRSHRTSRSGRTGLASIMAKHLLNMRLIAGSGPPAAVRRGQAYAVL